MKLHNEAAPVETFGVTESSSFSIAMNAKAFRVLSDSLYENKIGSIVREISCNAYDAHIMAGKKDVPFEIHLPNAFEPWFAVQDYGVGLTPDAIKTVFTVYFSSTKDQSNDAIGAFGLGAKTPFAYTDQFTVTSVVDGIKRIYSAYISGSGVPDIALMDESATDEQNGVEIRMSVKREDYTRFANEVVEQLKYFKVKPTLKNSSVSFTEETRTPLYISDDCVVYSSSRYKNFVIVQGNVGYSLDIDNLSSSTAATAYKDSLSFINNFTSHDVHLIFPIGSIGVTASREGVEYDDKTVTNICKAIQKLEQDYLQQLKDRISKKTTDWEKIEELQADTFNMRFASQFQFAPEFKINRNMFNLSLAGITTKEVTEQVDVMIAGKLEKKTLVRSQSVATINTLNTTIYNNRRNRSVVHTMPIYPKDKIVLIGRDKNTLAERKLQYFFTTNKQYTIPYEVRSEDGTDVKVIINKLKALMGVDVKVVMLSEIVLPEEVKAPSIRNGAAQYYKYYRFESSIRQWDVIRETALTDLKHEVYYLTHDGAHVNHSELSNAIVYLQQLNLDPKDHLIAISAKKEILILDKPNFMSIEKLKEKAHVELQKQKANLIKKYRTLYAASTMNLNLRDIRFLDSIAAELPTSDLAKIYRMNNLLTAKANSTKETLATLSKKLNTIGVENEKIMKKVDARVAKFCATIHKYPLLPVLSNLYCRDNAKAKDVVQYVKALNATF